MYRVIVTEKHKVLLVFTLIILTASTAPGSGPGWPPVCPQRGSAVPLDTMATSTESPARLYFDLSLGQQYLSGKWDPYPTTTNVAVSCLGRSEGSPLWIDGSIDIGWAGPLDAEGHRGPRGISLVQIQGGLGHVWSHSNFPLAFYAAGGCSYVWAEMEVEDKSQTPQINPMFPDSPIYPDIKQEGHFFGGYARCGFMYHLWTDFNIGIGLSGKVTTSRDLLDRHLNVNSAAIGLFVGVQQ